MITFTSITLFISNLCDEIYLKASAQCDEDAHKIEKMCRITTKTAFQSPYSILLGTVLALNCFNKKIKY